MESAVVSNACLPEKYAEQITADINTGVLINVTGYVSLLAIPAYITTGMFHDYWLHFRYTNQTAIAKYGLPILDKPKTINILAYTKWELEDLFLKFIDLDTDTRKNKLLGLDLQFETGQRFTVRRCTELDHRYVAHDTKFTTLQVTDKAESDSTRAITALKKKHFGELTTDLICVFIGMHVAKDDPIII